MGNPLAVTQVAFQAMAIAIGCPANRLITQRQRDAINVGWALLG